MASLSHAKVGLVQFPGSNCDADCVDVLKRHFQIDTKLIWHTENSLPKLDALIIPGGFSYGDYLRSGALASHSPIMIEVKKFAASGGSIIGICNGFQILTESHLLPGMLLRNQYRKFICEYVTLATARGESTYHKALKKPARIPIAHGEGRYYIDQDGLKKLKDGGQIVYQYADASGVVTPEVNPNGAVENIAGIVSENGRVMGMMPHPERASDLLLGGSDDGLHVWKAFLASFL